MSVTNKPTARAAPIVGQIDGYPAGPADCAMNEIPEEIVNYDLVSEAIYKNQT